MNPENLLQRSDLKQYGEWSQTGMTGRSKRLDSLIWREKKGRIINSFLSTEYIIVRRMLTHILHSK